MNSRAEPQPSDVDLVRRSQDGDGASFGLLVERYQDRVFNTCYRMCNDRADALDLTQTTFLKAYEALGRFQTRARFYTWLYRIAINLVFSHLRARRHRVVASLDQEHPDHDPVHDPARRAEQHELRSVLADALGALGEEFRVVVVLKDIEELDYATIAEIVDVPVGTVKSRIHRGRLLLRTMLTETESVRERV